MRLIVRCLIITLGNKIKELVYWVLALFKKKHMIQLYIGKQKADLDSSVSVSLIHKLENLSNPTDVNGSYSLTISLPGTKNNNKIFADYWKLDKYITQHTGNTTAGVDFSPINRVEASLYQNGDILLQGYIQLNSISRIKNTVSYDISLYSSECDFFQNLKIKPDGTTRTLADLRWFIKSGNTVLPEDQEFNFRINKDIVSSAYLKEWDDDNDQLLDFLTFIPSYNGLYEDFDNQSVLINTNGDSIFPKEYTVDGQTYTTQNGYLLGKLNKDYTEWETRDLRSYKQRPAIKLNKLIKTIIRKENSGYDVELDPEFFNNSNPYWTDSFVMLPLLGTNNQSNDENKVTGTLTKGTGSWVLNVNNSNIEGNIVNSLADVSQYPYNANTQVNLDISLSLTANSSASDLYVSTAIYPTPQYSTRWGSIVYQLVAYNESNEIIGYSPVYNFTNYMRKGLYNPRNSSQYREIVPGSSITNIAGRFHKNGSSYYFIEDETNSNTFRIELTTTKQASTVKLVLYQQWVRSKDYEAGEVYTKSYFYENDPFTKINGTSVTQSFASSDAVSVNWYSNIVSGSLIDKNLLLRNDKSCCDYLLSFTKLFGLYFVTDSIAKKIKILSRRSFFTGEVVDIEDKIDYSKDMTITPILFDKKYYRMKFEFPETKSFKKYKSLYDQTYGQKRLDTGYNFNSEINDLYENNIYQGSIPVLGTSKYYRNFYNKSNDYIPSYLIDNMEVSYYKDSESAENTLYGVNFYDHYTEFNNIPGNDIFAKQEFCTEDNQLQDITNSLVFYNGRIGLIDSKNAPVRYWVTDDLIEMGTLNDNQNCWLYPGNGFDASGKEIAVRLYELPQYISLQTDGSDNVVSSFDLGLPKETFLTAKYSEDKTLYNQYWKSFYNDQLNVNTRKINCFMKLDFANQEMLRKFYWFQNSYWILNKIDYSPTNNQTTSVEFIKVFDKDNYQ